MNLLVGLGIVDHVLVGVGLGVDAGLGALDGESEGVHDDDGVAVGLALHEAHNLDGAAGARVDHHLQQSQGGDPHALEEVRVVAPRLLLLELVLQSLVVEEYRVRLAPYAVLRLPPLLRYLGIHSFFYSPIRSLAHHNPLLNLNSQRRREVNWVKIFA